MGDKGVRFRGSRQQLLDIGEEGIGGAFYVEDEVYRPSLKQNSLSTLYALPTIIVIFSLLGLVYLMDQRLPAPLTLNDVQQHPERFIEERAKAHLHNLLSVGPKPTGSYENEVLTVDYIKREIEYVMQLLSGSKTIHFDVQKPTGAFYLNVKRAGFISYYADIQNIIVRLSDRSNRKSLAAVLINCHFDSVPTSPGGSDDIANCAVMLEVLRILSTSPVSLSHDIVFLFNGAEENILQASHGFISQHKWANDIKAFVNLEACGAGGREILFQTVKDNSWLLKVYGSVVPFPHATVVAEEIFQSGLIPSDTDFRIFRDFGNIPGLDFAHTKNGYVYHTKYDNEDQVLPGTLQHTGDNILALLVAVANSPHLEASSNNNEGSLVFFDLFGFFLISYSQFQGTVVNIFVAMLSVSAVLRSAVSLGAGINAAGIVYEVCAGISASLVGWFLAVAWSILLALSLDWLKCSMSWYAQPLVIIPLYFCPAVVLSSLGIMKHLRKKSVVCGAVRIQFYCLGVQLLWTSLLVGATLLQLRSAYLLSVLVVFPSLAMNAMLWLFPSTVLKGLLTVYLPSLVPSFLLVVYHALLAMSTFIPIMGRIASDVNSELIVASLSTVLCLMSISYLIPLLFLLRRPALVLGSLAVLHLITYCAIVFTPFAFPYSVSEPNAIFPKRVFLWHVDREIYDLKGNVRYTDSGFWLANFDRNSPFIFEDDVTELASAQLAKTLCDSEMYWGLPIYVPPLAPLISDSLWIPGPPPTIYQPVTVDLMAHEATSENLRRFTFMVSGPDHIGVMFSPKPHVMAVGWNLQAELTASHSFNNRPVYFIFYAHGLEGRPWNLSIDLKINANYTSQEVLDLGVAGHYLHHQKHFTGSFTNLLGKFPSWAHVTPWVSTMKMWVF